MLQLYTNSISSTPESYTEGKNKKEELEKHTQKNLKLYRNLWDYNKGTKISVLWKLCEEMTLKVENISEEQLG